MKYKLIAVAGLALTVSLAGIAQPAPAQISRQELHSLIRNAHDAAGYRQLASYYRQQETQYRAQATAELAERNRRAQNTMGSAQKYPRPVDSAQNLYESYQYQADHAAAQAQHYEQLAATPASKS
jgi:hypothetical protein